MIAATMTSRAATLAAGVAASLGHVNSKLQGNPQQGAPLLRVHGPRAIEQMQAAGTSLSAAAGSLMGGQGGSVDAQALSRALGAVQQAVGQIDSSMGGISAKAGPIGLADVAGRLLAAASSLKQAMQGVGQQMQALPGAAPPAQLISLSPLTMPTFSSAELLGAASATPHLLTIVDADGGSYSFGLGTAAYDSLKRSASYGIASHDRLNRAPALQAVGKAAETITLSGAIYTAGKAGARQLQKLREIAGRTKPLLLTTGYGEILGRWYLGKVDEEQSYLMADGAPRKQAFTLEFQRYGEDYQNL